MSITNLMLLGFLMEKPMNAYEIKKEVENRNLTWWIKGSSPSIYRNINALSAKGYIDGEVVREGEMPEKTIYTINNKGITYFNEMMEQYSCNPPKIYLDFTAVISNIGKIDTEIGKQRIMDLYSYFKNAKEILEKLETKYTPYQAKAVIQLSEKMYDLICEWLEQFYKDYFGAAFPNAKI